MAQKKDHIARQQRATKLTGGEKWALAVILLGAVVFAVSMVSMGGDVAGKGTRASMGIQFRTWVTLDGRPVPSVTALVGIAIAVWGVLAANRAHSRRPADRV